ncbi:ninjurin-A-like [Anopheles nili]|uniref:ninjurin-A-like n=1 Tax=Anopheles nili TaxID=185578 RepID=UPI00237BEAB0|nr:ninjurin-A-like [Anopheles nili]
MASSIERDSKAVEIAIEDTATDETDSGRVNARRTLAVNVTGNNRNGNRSRSNSRSPARRAKRDTEKARTDAIPLLPGQNESELPRQEPPMAGPELDDDEDTLDTALDLDDPGRNNGIDDGFYDPIDNGKRDDSGTRAGRRGGRRNQQPGFPTGPTGFTPGIATDVPTTINGEIIPDVNVYQQKKNLAQGMMDLALLSANANQLRYVLDSSRSHPYFYVNLIFITTSIIAQVVVGIGLIWKSRYNINKNRDLCKADRLNNLITIGIFIITLVNVLISAFGLAGPQPVT